MAEEYHDLTRAFSGLGGLGVEEPALVAAVAWWRRQPEKRAEFRRSFPGFFGDHGAIEKCEEEYMLHLAAEFSRFQKLMVVWAMHPWERDARWAHHVLHGAHPSAVLVEIACTRSSDELLGARKAYQALFHRSLEEDVADHVKGVSCSLLVGLVSAYRYEGPKVSADVAKSEAKALGSEIRSAGADGALLGHEEVVRILTTRSKPHLAATFEYYKELHGKCIEEDLSNVGALQETVKCLATPAIYFSQVIGRALQDGADHHAKDALTRVIVSRSDIDVDSIREAYEQQYGAQLEDAIAKKTHGCYRDALLSLIGV